MVEGVVDLPPLAIDIAADHITHGPSAHQIMGRYSFGQPIADLERAARNIAHADQSHIGIANRVKRLAKARL